VTAGARFDDLLAGAALAFPAARETVVATSSDEVADALRRVERRCAQGNWAYGFVGYEAAPGLNADLVTHRPDGRQPVAWFGICGEPTRTAPVPARVGAARGYRVSRWRLDWDEACHRERVQRVRSHIEAGETYQCNLTARMRARCAGDLTAFYADLAHAQHGAHSAFVDTGRFAVLSASPELFFERRGERVALRPMKGTAARGRDAAEDAVRAAALRTNPKERAENIMIVDLLRNDIGMIARTGSVVTSRLCAVEEFRTVFQLTSRIDAEVGRERSIVDLFRALFPCGSVTGAPKGATMRIIRELETSPRGVYCGAVGHLGPTGDARFSVAIRTVVVDRHTGLASYGTGGGITWCSDPAAEYTELLAKTRILHHVDRLSTSGPGASSATSAASPRSARRPSIPRRGDLGGAPLVKTTRAAPIDTWTPTG
jgi:para-aminobenzoate synthetase/4-amino-4-deoxychorismate lyase